MRFGNFTLTRFQFALPLVVVIAVTVPANPGRAAATGVVGGTPQAPAAATDADRTAVPGLMQKGDWEGARKIVESLLGANPEDAQARRWQIDITPVDTWPAVWLRGKEGLTGSFWLRRKWVGFSVDPAKGRPDPGFQIPIQSLVEVWPKSITDWVAPGYGQVTHGFEIKTGNAKYRIVTAFPTYEVNSMYHRIVSMQIKSLQPEAPLPPLIEVTLRGRDAAQVKSVLQESIQSGRWRDADAALRQLSKLRPDDPEIKQFEDEIKIVNQWSVRFLWYTADGAAGTLYLRKHWLTLESEDHSWKRNKPLKNDSFHLPLSALRAVSTCKEDDYGAKSGTGGLLDLVMASDVATGKNWGFSLEFATGKKYKLIVRGKEGDSKDAVKEDVQRIQATANLRQ